jgi:hypothetical protein
MPDGQHVTGVTPTGESDTQNSKITAVLDWFEELKARVPTK